MADAQELGIPVDSIGVGANIIYLHRRCLGGPYKEGTVRSQRDLFGVFLDQSISAEARQMLVTPVTEHLIRFVYKGSKESDPEGGKEDALITPEGVLLTE